METPASRNLLIGVTRLAGLFFLIERVPYLAYSVLVQIYNESRYRGDAWNSNARLGVIGSIVESVILTQLVTAIPVIVVAVFLIWKAPWLVDRILPSVDQPERATKTDGLAESE